MLKSIVMSITVMTYLASPALALTPEQIKDVHLKGSAYVLEQIGGQEMEFTGAVVSRTRPFAESPNLLAVRIDAGDIDVVGYVRTEVQAGQNVTMRGTLAGIGMRPKVTVTLHPASLSEEP